MLAELYRVDPTLREYEEQLKHLITQMTDLRPDSQFTPALAARLKEEVMKTVQQNNHLQENNFNFNFMNKKFYYFAAPALVLGVVAVIVLLNPVVRTGDVARTGVFNNKASDEGVSRLAANAFGVLSGASSSAVQNEAAPLAARSVDSTLSGELASVSSDGDMAVTSGVATAPGFALGLGGGGAMDGKMIMPYFDFKYVYTGDPIVLEEGSSDVYRRLKGGSTAARSLASMVGNLDLSGVKLSKFSNLSATNLTLTEEKEKGLMITLDFMEDSIYISENWQRWILAERDACGQDEACWARFRLSINDVPADSELIAMTNKFMSDHEIDLQNYGTPEVDNNWRLGYDIAEDKNNFYIPEYASVVYPLLINNEPVRDQGGNYAGIRVNINLLQKGVTGLYGLTPFRYEASAYALETSAERIIRIAENGGQGGMFFNGSETGTTEIQLGTPTKSYVQTYRYQNNRSEELLVPALVFPILNPEAFGFYGQRSVIVPLVQEMLGELEARNVPGDGGIGIMPVIMEARQ